MKLPRVPVGSWGPHFVRTSLQAAKLVRFRGNLASVWHGARGAESEAEDGGSTTEGEMAAPEVGQWPSWLVMAHTHGAGGQEFTSIHHCC